MTETTGLCAGAAVVDITPTELPALCNGEFVARMVDLVDDPLSVRALVLECGQTSFALAVVDTCMIPDWIHERAKELASAATGLRSDHILISATHCHSAPSLMPILGTDVDERYAPTIPDKIAEAVAQAWRRRVPARIGYACGSDPENVFCRRFIMRPGTAWTENRAFTGSRGDIAQMNPFDNHDAAICPTGWPDPRVHVLAVTRDDGRPLAVFGNYSTHYAGADHLSADYFAVFRNRMKELLDADDDFVGIMSNGTSGDSNCIDFRNLERKYDRFTVGESVAQKAAAAWRSVVFDAAPRLDMTETTLTLDTRMPTAEQVGQARGFLESLEGRTPQTCEEVYARETVLMAAMPTTRTLHLQTIRIGSLAIAAIPAEVYSFTGREIRAASPFENTFTISLANGSNGYLPTEESFDLGGYTTWRARTSCLEETAERKIRNRVIRSLYELHAGSEG